MNEKRLLIAAEIFPPAIGGPATYAATLARELMSRGWETAVVCYADRVDFDGPAKVYPTQKSGGAFARYGRYFKTLWRHVGSYPLLYAQGPVSSGLPALIVAKLRKKKLAVKVTGDYAWEQAFRAGTTRSFLDAFQRERIGGKYGLLRWIERYVCRHAHMVITPSVYLRNIVIGWGVSADRVTVVYNAVPVNTVTETRSAIRSRRGIADQQFLVVSAGRPVPWKGFAILGQTAARLIARDNVPIALFNLGITDVQFYKFLGQDPSITPADQEQIRGLVHPVARRTVAGIFNCGTVPQEELLAWLKAADVFVLNTAYEGLSHLVLEAMRAGTAVVTTNVGGNPELVRSGENGILVEYNNTVELQAAILELCRHPKRRAQLAAAASQVVAKFTMPEMLLNTERLLRTLISL